MITIFKKLHKSLNKAQFFSIIIGLIIGFFLFWIFYFLKSSFQWFEVIFVFLTGLLIYINDFLLVFSIQQSINAMTKKKAKFKMFFWFLLRMLFLFLFVAIGYIIGGSNIALLIITILIVIKFIEIFLFLLLRNTPTDLWII